MISIMYVLGTVCHDTRYGTSSSTSMCIMVLTTDSRAFPPSVMIYQRRTAGMFHVAHVGIKTMRSDCRVSHG